MTTPNTDTDRRLHDVETKLREAVSELRDHALRLAVVGDIRDVRLAKTANQPGEVSYPTTGDTFYCEFQDCKFSPELQGTRTITSTSREGTTRGDGVVARNITDDYIPEGTLVWVLWQRGTDTNPATEGEYWIERVVPSNTKLYIARIQLTTTLADGAHQTASATVLECSDNTVAEIGSSITVEDHTETLYKGESGYEGTAYAFKDDLDSGCNWTLLDLEEKAEVALFTLVSGFASGETTGTMNDYWQGRQPDATETIVDRLGILDHLSANDKVIASYDENDDKYIVIEAELWWDASEVCARQTAFETVTGYTKAAFVDKVKVLQPNRDSNLSLYVGNANDDWALLNIEPAYYNHSILHSDGSKVRWKQHLEIAKTMHTGMVGVGSGAGPGGQGDGWAWWKQTAPPIAPANSTYFWLGQGGDKSQKWLVPEDESHDEVNGVLFFKETGTTNGDPNDPTCLQLGYTEPGLGDGVNNTVASTLCVLGCDYKALNLTFDRGVLVYESSGVLELVADGGNAWCKDNTWPTVDPCNPPT